MGGLCVRCVRTWSSIHGMQAMDGASRGTPHHHTVHTLHNLANELYQGEFDPDKQPQRGSPSSQAGFMKNGIAASGHHSSPQTRFLKFEQP